MPSANDPVKHYVSYIALHHGEFVARCKCGFRVSGSQNMVRQAGEDHLAKMKKKDHD